MTIDPKQEMVFLNSIRLNSAATLAAALIQAAGRPHSPEEAVALTQDIAYLLNPQPNQGSHAMRIDRGKKVHT